MPKITMNFARTLPVRDTERNPGQQRCATGHQARGSLPLSPPHKPIHVKLEAPPQILKGVLLRVVNLHSRLPFFFCAAAHVGLAFSMQTGQRDRAVKVMDSKSIGLCPQGLESPRCRLVEALPAFQSRPRPEFLGKGRLAMASRASTWHSLRPLH